MISKWHQAVIDNDQDALEDIFASDMSSIKLEDEKAACEDDHEKQARLACNVSIQDQLKLSNSGKYENCRLL